MVQKPKIRSLSSKIVRKSPNEHFSRWWIGRQGMRTSSLSHSEFAPLVLPVETDKTNNDKSENQHHRLQLNLLEKFVSGTSFLYIKLRKI
jgi:hypothetical protein